MKLSLKRELILQPLQLVNGIVEKRLSQQILSHVLINVEREHLTLSTTDKETGITVSIPFISGDAKIKFTVSSQKFLDICRSLPENSQLELEFKENNRLFLRSAKSRFTLSTLPYEDYPDIVIINNPNLVKLKQKHLKYLLEKTHFSMAHQDVRYYLNGLLLKLTENNLLAISSDGHRLAFAQVNYNIENSLDAGAIIPRKAIIELLRLLSDDDNSDVTIYIAEKQLQFHFSNIVFTSNVLDGQFPDYNRVIPYNSTKKIIIDKDLLRQCLLRASILSHDKFRSARFEFFESKLCITVHNPEQEEAIEEIDILYEGCEGNPFEIGFNIAYILDALTALTTEKIILSMSDPNASCLIENYYPDDFSEDSIYYSKYVIMPMRL